VKKFIIILLTLCGAAIFAEDAPKKTPKKFALIIYNANYNEDRLLNYPLQDMSDKDKYGKDYRVVDKLRDELISKGWTVVDFIQDGSRTDMIEGINSLINRLKESTGAQCLFYYIGHARETYGVNYLYPVRNTPINDVRKQALSVNDVVNGMKKVNRNGGNFVIIDYSQNQTYNGTMGGSDGNLLAKLKDDGAVVRVSDSQIVQGRTNIKHKNGLYTVKFLEKIREARRC